MLLNLTDVWNKGLKIEHAVLRLQTDSLISMMLDTSVAFNLKRRFIDLISSMLIINEVTT